MFGVVSFLSVFCLLLSTGLSEVTVRQQGNRVIQVKAGKIRGVLVEFPYNPNLKSIEAFLGIKYASLTGTRGARMTFMHPGSFLQRWWDVKQFKQMSPVCPQEGSRGLSGLPDGRVNQITRMAEKTQQQSEDCLYLNVYAPQREWDAESLPVMIFVHGESWEIGTGNAYDGSVLASYGGVIVITVNYRLGVLGFLSTGDGNAEGNYALLDLLAILVWVRDNIAAFGGDPNRVTLFGHGHGAALVNLFMFSSIMLDDSYFNNVILQSGSAASTWATSIDPILCTQLLAKNVNCSHVINNSKLLVDCLKQKSVDDLVKNVPVTPKYYSCFAPSLGLPGVFPKGKTLEQLIQDKGSIFANKKIMFGLTRKEAYSYLKQEEIENGISESQKEKILRTYVQNVYSCNRQKIYDILEHQYTRWDKPQDDSTRRDDIMDLISDGQFKAPLVRMAQEHSRTADTYMYTFGYSTQSEDYSQWSGGVHGDELPYIFGAPLVGGLSPFPSQYNAQEKELSKMMIRLWTNFAKTGDPNLPENTRRDADRGSPYNFDDIKWPKYNMSQQQYLQIGRRGPVVKDFYRGQELAMWLHLIPKINAIDNKNADTNDLENANNISTFDDPQRLINKFHSIFPSPPPIPPYTPPNTQQSDGKSVTEQEDVTDSTADYTNYSEGTSKSSKDTSTTLSESGEVKPTVSPVKGVATTSVPLSITVAVGCSLLFLNLLIFAGVYYQRERIRKMRGDDSSGGSSRLNRKTDKEEKGELPQEAACLMQTPQVQASPAKVVNLNHKSNVETNPIYSSITKPVPPPSGYSYSALSQKSSSPMHSNQIPRSTNSIPQAESAPLTTRPGANHVRPEGDRSPKMEPRVKTMPRANHQVTSNNAITIV